MEDIQTEQAPINNDEDIEMVDAPSDDVAVNTTSTTPHQPASAVSEGQPNTQPASAEDDDDDFSLTSEEMKDTSEGDKMLEKARAAQAEEKGKQAMAQSDPARDDDDADSDLSSVNENVLKDGE
jgi:hypothetical protein